MASHSSQYEPEKSRSAVATPDVDQCSVDATSLFREVARGWLVRLASGDIAEEEMRRLKEWLAVEQAHRDAFAHERRLWRQVEPLRGSLAASLTPGTLTRARRSAAALSSWARTCARQLGTSVLPLAPSRPRTRQLAFGGLFAACVALLILLGNPLLLMRADHATGVGEITRAALPDGSTAILNTNSAIAVHFTSGERRVDLLKGEAWFEVKPNRLSPFRVHSGGGVAEAVGTAFSVATDHLGTLVRVTKGVVSVSGGGADLSVNGSPARVANDAQSRARLIAGTQVHYSGGEQPGPVTDFDADVQLSWRNRRIVIEDLPLGQAIAALDRYRPGRIVLLDKAHAQAHVSGTFTIGSLDQSLEELASTQGLHVIYFTRYLAVVR